MSEQPESPPPILGSWRTLYTLVLGVLAFEVVLFTAITWVYR